MSSSHSTVPTSTHTAHSESLISEISETIGNRNGIKSMDKMKSEISSNTGFGVAPLRDDDEEKRSYSEEKSINTDGRGNNVGGVPTTSVTLNRLSKEPSQQQPRKEKKAESIHATTRTMPSHDYSDDDSDCSDDGTTNRLSSTSASRSSQSSSSFDSNERVVFNVGGKRFETYASTLINYPDTLLGAMFAKRNRRLRRPDANGEYFFDRDPDAFAVVLNFFRTGKVILKPGTTQELIDEELAYFNVNVQKKSREVFSWGRGEFGQLGHGSRSSYLRPQIIKALSGHRRKVVHISLGTSHSAALTDAGIVFTWGYGGDGRLGHGNELDQLVPKVLQALSPTFISDQQQGHQHIDQHGHQHIDQHGHQQLQYPATSSATTTGTSPGKYDNNNRLSQQSYQQMSNHVQSTTHRQRRQRGHDASGKALRITQIMCGELHTAAMTASGDLYTWGLGKDGRLGHGDRRSHSSPELVENLRENGVKIAGVSCGGLHTAAISTDGHVYTWGLGKDGRLGHGDEYDQLFPQQIAQLKEDFVVQIVCGGHHTACLTSSGNVFTWGFDDDGRLGHGTFGHKYRPTVVEELCDVEIVQIACGCWHSAALSSDGVVYTWGSCKSGQLGQAHKNSMPTPRRVLHGIGGGIAMIACGTAHTAAVTNQGELFTWGKAADGRLGYTGTLDQVTPKQVNAFGPRKVIAVACGVYDTAVLLNE